MLLMGRSDGARPPKMEVHLSVCGAIQLDPWLMGALRRTQALGRMPSSVERSTPPPHFPSQAPPLPPSLGDIRELDDTCEAAAEDLSGADLGCCSISSSESSSSLGLRLRLERLPGPRERCLGLAMTLLMESQGAMSSEATPAPSKESHSLPMSLKKSVARSRFNRSW